jgi:hypothetical protein
MRTGLVFLLVNMRGGNSCRTLSRGIGQVFVALKPNGNPDLGLCANCAGNKRRVRGPDYPEDSPSAADRHILAQRNLRGHSQREFDLSTFSQEGVSEKKDSAGTQILGKPDTFDARSLAQ